METAVFSITLGLCVGILSGLLGIGGGTVLVTVFNLAFGMSAVHSTATSLFTIIPTSLSGAIGHLRNKTCIIVVGLCSGVGGALFSPVGVWAASASPEWLVMIAVAAVVAYSSLTMFQKALKLKRQNNKKANENSLETESSCSTTHNNCYTFSVPLAAKSGAIGAVAGLLAGYVGLGGGFLMVPLYMNLLGMTMKQASGTSLSAIMLIAIPGTIAQALLGNVEWIVGALVAVGSFPGAAIGAKLTTRVPELALRFAFGCFLIVMAALIVITQFV